MPDVKRLRFGKKKREMLYRGIRNDHRYVVPKPYVHRQVGAHFRGIQVIDFNPIKKKFIDGPL